MFKIYSFNIRLNNEYITCALKEAWHPKAQHVLSMIYQYKITLTNKVFKSLVHNMQHRMSILVSVKGLATWLLTHELLRAICVAQ